MLLTVTFNSTSRILDFLCFLIISPMMRMVTWKSLPASTAREAEGFVYDYDLKDHLGNVRLTFSTEKKTETFLATMEKDDPQVADRESNEFPNYVELAVKNRFVASTLYDHTKSGDSQYSLNLNAGKDGMIGLAKSFKVKAGDKIHMETYATYFQPSNTGEASAIANIGMALAGALMQTPGSLESAGAIDHISSQMYGAGPWLDEPDEWEDSDAPKICWKTCKKNLINIVRCNREKSMSL